MSTPTPTPLLAHLLAHPDFRAARLPSLYSDFRHLRTNNPSGFTANTAAWASALTSAARAGLLTDTLVLRTGEALVAGLAMREWGRPLGLGCVVAEAVARREWFPVKMFLEQAESVYYRAWINPWGLLSWGLETAGLKGRGGEEEVGKGAEFVLLKNVEESAQQLLSQISLLPAGVARLFTLPLLLSTYPNPLTNAPYTPTDLRILLKFLTRDLRVVSLSGSTLKFADAGRDPTPITEHDHTIARLKGTIATLHAQTDALAAQIAACTDKARAALQAQNRILALGALRSRKLAEGTLERRVAVLGQLEEVLGRIEQAGDNAEMLAQMKRCGRVLRALNRETGGVERVDEVLDEVRGQMDEVEEVTRVLGAVGLEDGEVEEEMEEMLAEEETRREKERSRRVVEELGRLSLEEVEAGAVGREKGKEEEGKKKEKEEEEEEEENEEEKKVAVPAS